MLTSSPTRTIEENLPLSDKVYIIETNIIRELAEKGDCVIVGRCASYILRDLENLFNVFIYADTKSRSERAVQEYHVDLCLNSGALGLELCADIVVETAKKTIY